MAKKNRHSQQNRDLLQQRQDLLQQRQTLTATQLSVRRETFAGPLPPPEVLAHYAQIFPELPKILVARYESQAEHRQSLEKRAVDSNIKREKTGQWMAFILSFLAIGGGLYLSYLGKDLSGIVAIVTAVAGLATVFITEKILRKKERDEKMQAVTKSRQ